MADEKKDLSGKKILVVEDDNDARRAICTMLQALGYAPTEFSSGTAALEKIDELNYDLALLDIMMPEMSGYDLLEELRKVDRLKDLPIIMVTAKDQDDEILQGYQTGADYYITKPFTSKQLDYGIRLFLDPQEE